MRQSPPLRLDTRTCVRACLCESSRQSTCCFTLQRVSAASAAHISTNLKGWKWCRYFCFSPGFGATANALWIFERVTQAYRPNFDTGLATQV